MISIQKLAKTQVKPVCMMSAFENQMTGQYNVNEDPSCRTLYIGYLPEYVDDILWENVLLGKN